MSSEGNNYFSLSSNRTSIPETLSYLQFLRKKFEEYAETMDNEYSSGLPNKQKYDEFVRDYEELVRLFDRLESLKKYSEQIAHLSIVDDGTNLEAKKYNESVIALKTSMARDAKEIEDSIVDKSKKASLSLNNVELKRDNNGNHIIEYGENRREFNDMFMNISNNQDMLNVSSHLLESFDISLSTKDNVDISESVREVTSNIDSIIADFDSLQGEISSLLDDERVVESAKEELEKTSASLDEARSLVSMDTKDKLMDSVRNQTLIERNIGSIDVIDDYGLSYGGDVLGLRSSATRAVDEEIARQQEIINGYNQAIEIKDKTEATIEDASKPIKDEIERQVRINQAVELENLLISNVPGINPEDIKAQIEELHLSDEELQEAINIVGTNPLLTPEQKAILNNEINVKVSDQVRIEEEKTEESVEPATEEEIINNESLRNAAKAYFIASENTDELSLDELRYLKDNLIQLSKMDDLERAEAVLRQHLIDNGRDIETIPKTIIDDAIQEQLRINESTGLNDYLEEYQTELYKEYEQYKSEFMASKLSVEENLEEEITEGVGVKL